MLEFSLSGVTESRELGPDSELGLELALALAELKLEAFTDLLAEAGGERDLTWTVLARWSCEREVRGRYGGADW